MPLRPLPRSILLLALLLPAAVAAAQEAEPWYKNMPEKAVMAEDGKSMRIGGKTYPVYNAYDPIAPTGGERVIDSAGVLDYYMWAHKKPGGTFTVSRIDMSMNIFYYDEQTGRYTSPGGRYMSAIETSP